MTISSSLNAGVAGLSANASRLGTISDNIANASTAGYKRVETDFQSMVISQGGSQYTAGGVRTTTQRMVDQAGALVSTNNATDLAIRGDGFLPVVKATEVRSGSADTQMYLATTGSFEVDADGYLRTESGLLLMGVPANGDGSIPPFSRDTDSSLEPIRMNLDQLSADPTTSISLGVNLPSTETNEAGAGLPMEPKNIQYFDDFGAAQSLDVTFTPTPAAAGAPQTNEWNMSIVDNATGTVIGDYVITFNDGTAAPAGTISTIAETVGTAYDPIAGVVTVTTASGPIEIDLGPADRIGPMQQLAGEYSTSSIEVDGSEVSLMTGIEVDENGFVQAFFDSGATKTIYQIPLIDVANPNGLKASDGQIYSVTPESGDFYLWNAGDGPVGSVVSFAREESATDVASELTDMIQTQRAYSTNAKVIQTVDEMLQETTNIKR
ncbi:flagellar hook protein FlgE [Cognatishimia sp. F0-27]|uniref:flagellar hook protein FlgE n=1 Tax=Cognatishimia sp. F0-27 TaxID=2816855 RepID=UPI001D0C2CF3|nr:flagellar hook-basal body complex protein [Cognatishimia sp. F0-27]MCC1492391.1 flagellar hook-basal body complex protein [Cognatishimia sp. F0-27]